MASYYHDKFHGRRASSGERFNQNKLTGAHRKLLFNTMVKVTNLQNDRSVIVRINDRGPYKYKGRIIDLTLTAAKELKMDKKGVAMVKIEVVGEAGKINYASPNFPGSFEVGKCYNYRGEIRNPKGYGIQVAAFAELVNARYFAKEMFREGFREIVIKVGNPMQDTANYKIIVGEYKNKDETRNLIQKLEKKDFFGFAVQY
ncbi:MAG: septal ring lytic transglycosylase RlpA family protein [Cytophagales bacterium]